MLTAGRFLAFVVASLASSVPLHALSAKVFVTPVGKDSPSCGALLSPCKTLAGAVSAVAAGGTVVVLTPGEYGIVTITKALTIDATGVTALVQASSDAVTISAGSSDTVTLKGLTLSTGNFANAGVMINSAGAVNIEGCTIRGFANGVFAFDWTGRLSMVATTARNNNEGASLRSPSGRIDVSIERCVFESNGAGISVRDGAHAVVRGTTATDGIHGITAQAIFGGSVELTVVDCLVSGNVTGAGITSEGDSGSALVHVSGSTVTGNQRGLVQSTFGGSSAFFSRGDNTVEGNEQGDLSGTIQSYSGK
jgi:hypothetical protein